MAEGRKLRNQGDISGAIRAFSRAVSAAEHEHNDQALTRALISLGIVQVANLQYRTAFRTYERAALLCQHLGDAYLAGSTAGNLATLYAQVGDWPSAEAEAGRAITFLRHAEHADARTHKQLARALQCHAYLCFFLKKNPEGYAESTEALSISETLGDLELQSLLWDMRGSALTLQNRITEADISLRHALALSEKVGDKDGIAFAREHLAELELRKSHPDWKLALRLINEVEAQHGSLFKMHPHYIPSHLKGEILLGSGNKIAALSEFQQAVTAANEWREVTLPGDTSGTMTGAALQDVYVDYAHLAAETALATGDKSLAANSLDVLIRNRSANLGEEIRRAYSANWKLPDNYYYKLSELQQAQAKVTLGKGGAEEKEKLRRIRLEISNLENQIGIKPEKSLIQTEKNPRRNSLSDIQRTLARDQVLISLSLGKKQSYMWAVTGDQVHLSKLGPEAEIQSRADAFKTLVQAGGNLASAGDGLSRVLFSGLPADTWDRREWLMVADGPLLNGIPLCALPQAGAKETLIERRSLRYLPSESLLLEHSIRPVSHTFIGVGDPIYNGADARLPKMAQADGKTVTANLASGRLARLPGSGEEVRSAAREVASFHPVLLTGAAANAGNLAATLEQGAEIIHFAVHVVSPEGQPQEAALALSLRNGFPELLTSEAVASLHAPGSLVVLSGCSSGQGQLRPGSGLMGLSRAWLLAGAAAVVVSSWPTLDDSGRFFSAFYQNYMREKTNNTARRAANALRTTQLEMLNGSGYQASPAFWGAFAVISQN